MPAALLDRMRQLLALPLLVVALSALFSSLQVACSLGRGDDVASEDALGGGLGYGYGV